MAELANEVGISVITLRSWVSILETSYIIFLLKPYSKNYGKRLIKAPKLYFYDTGLICSLLGIENKGQLETHYLRGSIFENMVISDYYKNQFFKGKEPQAYYWRDSSGLEIDLVVEENLKLNLYEIKSSSTINQKFFDGLKKFCAISGTESKNAKVIYGGDTTFPSSKEHSGFVSWKDIS